MSSEPSEEIPYRPPMVDKWSFKKRMKKQKQDQERILRQHMAAIRAWEIFLMEDED
jgi:hypothetical protein